MTPMQTKAAAGQRTVASSCAAAAPQCTRCCSPPRRLATATTPLYASIQQRRDTLNPGSRLMLKPLWWEVCGQGWGGEPKAGRGMSEIATSREARQQGS